MKHFTEPTGLFVIEIPTEWQYKNAAVGYEEVSPFGFELYEKPVGAFQISCYPNPHPRSPDDPRIRRYDERNLPFLETDMHDDEFNMHLWHCAVENMLLMAKYIYEPHLHTAEVIATELGKVKLALASLTLVSPGKRELALDLDRYEKFMAALGASFDLRNSARERGCLVELIVVLANQIDAYLRLCLTMKKQLDLATNDLDVSLLYQGPSDKPILEREVYRRAEKAGIIDESLFQQLEILYGQRNRIVHRYIISDIRTTEMYNIAEQYEKAFESVRLQVEQLENQQFAAHIGIYGGPRDPQSPHSESDVTFMMSMINDKHLLDHFKREIEP